MQLKLSDMILNKENMEQNKSNKGCNIDYETLHKAIENAIKSVVSIRKTMTINGTSYVVYGEPSNIVFKQDEVYDKELGSILFQIQLDTSGYKDHTRPTLHCEFDVKALKDSSDGEKHVWFDTNTYRMKGGVFHLSESPLEFYMADEGK